MSTVVAEVVVYWLKIILSVEVPVVVVLWAVNVTAAAASVLVAVILAVLESLLFAVVVGVVVAVIIFAVVVIEVV